MGPEANSRQVRILDGGAEAFPRMLAAIEGARASVHLEVYTFALDGTGERFAAALAAAARRGVQVRLVVDGVGSALDGRTLAAELGSVGVQVRIFNRLTALLLGRFARDHRKLLLVDDEVAFVGGVNVADDYLGAGGEPAWADLVAELRGPVCAWLGERLRGLRPAPLSGPVRLQLSGIGGGGRLRRRYLTAIGAARRSVTLAHGYFLPDRRLVRTITAAARRGVEVTLLLAGKSDVPFAHPAISRLHGRLLEAGVRIFEWERSVLHAKAAVMDGERMLLGSFNLDPLSLVNLETLLEVQEPGAVAAVGAWIERHLAAARAVAPEAGPGPTLRGRLRDALGRRAEALARLVGRLLRRDRGE